MLVGVSLLVSCTPPVPVPRPSTTSAAEIPGWTPVELPGAFVPSSLAADGSRVWVGGVAVRDRQPRVAVLRNAYSSDRVRADLLQLGAVSPYAADAEIVSLAAGSGRLAALGGVRDGAHSNVRWSIWEGRDGDSSRLQEHPQGFNTFGGPQAGDLVSVVEPTSGPVIAGTWSSTHGLDGAVWLPKAERWIRQPVADTVLASTARDQVSPRAAVADGDRVLMLGSLLVLGRSVQQRAAVWSWPTRQAGWTRQLLPQPTGRGEALAISCTGAVCVVFGHVADRLAGWQLGRDAPTALDDLPGAGLRTNRGASAFTVRTATGGRIGLAFTGEDDQGRLLLATATGWRLFAAPEGVAGSTVVVGNRIYLITGTGAERRLWTTDLGTVPV